MDQVDQTGHAKGSSSTIHSRLFKPVRTRSRQNEDLDRVFLFVPLRSSRGSANGERPLFLLRLRHLDCFLYPYLFWPIRMMRYLTVVVFLCPCCFRSSCPFLAPLRYSHIYVPVCPPSHHSQQSVSVGACDACNYREEHWVIIVYNRSVYMGSWIVCYRCCRRECTSDTDEGKYRY